MNVSATKMMKFTRFNAESRMLSGKSPAPVKEEIFEESAARVFSGNIKEFIAAKRSAGEYREFVSRIFSETLESGPDDPVWKLLGHIERETDFYTAPASTKYHGSEENGLVRHSLLVAANGICLAPLMLSGDVDMYYLTISCLFHDLCKTNMYEMKTRNLKNEKTGNWEKVPYYQIKDNYLSFGHGIESMLRLARYVSMPDSWNHAVRWHMGAFDISPMDKIALEKSLAAHKEVLLLQTADMQAGLVEEI